MKFCIHDQLHRINTFLNITIEHILTLIMEWNRWWCYVILSYRETSHSIDRLPIRWLCYISNQAKRYLVDWNVHFWRALVLFMGSLFWTSGGICPWFQSQCRSLACVLPCLCEKDSSDSPLVRHLLTSWQPAWQPSYLIHVLVHVYRYWLELMDWISV